MKILSCYITGFGKFTNQNFNFADLTVIKEDNGWGKTTLAAFIRCMLFGMEAGRGKAVESNDRLRYAPWQGGTYGGTMTFVCGGRQYRVERFFGRTPTQDMARVYDKNNMQCFDFGDRAERLGEVLFGVDADSYDRSVYIPQGEIETGGVSEDMKTRLLALLSNGGQGETSAERALQKLDEADRKLRAKRRPAKGKLDEIDERLDEISRLKTDADGNSLRVKQLRAQAAEAERDLLQCNQQLDELEKQAELLSRRNELTVAKDMQDRLAAAKEELSALRGFFGVHDPAALNIDGLQTAVDELYQCKERLRELDEQLSVVVSGEEREIRAKISACEKTLASYDEILAKKDEKKKQRPKGKKIVPKVTRRMRWFLTLSIVVALLGAGLFSSLLVLGAALLILGLAGMIFGFLWILPRREKVQESEPEGESAQDEISRLYDETYAELTVLKKQLAAKTGGNTAPIIDREGAERERTDLKEKIRVKEQSVAAFLNNFAFVEIYDYRAAVNQLRGNISRFVVCEKDVQNYENRLQEYSAEEISSIETQTDVDLSSVRAQRQAWNEKKEELLAMRSDCVNRAEAMETQYDKAALLTEESALVEEKVRLEKRHRAILAAREILLKAKENMASRYLDPVEKGCRYYLEILGGANNLRFAADGTLVYEDQGAFRHLGYYSVGTKELVGLCTRIALTDAVFRRELPVLIFDDPFVNLDDNRSERAKAFVKELSKRYQIIYLTCKTERKI